MGILEIYSSMAYGPALEDAKESFVWLDRHGRKFGHFIDGDWRAPAAWAEFAGRAKREWLAGDFSIADILMADVLRLVDRLEGLKDYPAARAYLARATARPAFVKAHDDQMAFFAAADLAKDSAKAS